VDCGLPHGFGQINILVYYICIAAMMLPAVEHLAHSAPCMACNHSCMSRKNCGGALSVYVPLVSVDSSGANHLLKTCCNCAVHACVSAAVLEVKS